ncbi:MAG TPA: hypothetical protein VFV67_17940 [Actinophytocola sp.]|nr:hypothetical protein [Actinophytocola sp.]HEU5472534.1 hypothetical protein [Actinophytocola sp.]
MPGGWFRTASVRGHYRRNPGGIPLVPIIVAAIVILVIIAVL